MRTIQAISRKAPTIRVVRGRRRRAPWAMTVVAAIIAGATGAVLAYFLDRERGKQRRHQLRDRATGLGRRRLEQAERQAGYAASRGRGFVRRTGAAVSHRHREYDDATLVRKVETEIFRPADAPKGSVSVNVHHGVVELRGEVTRPEQVKELGAAAERVDGVKRVDNLLHTAGSPPKHSPASDPDEVRARAEEPKTPSRFSRNPATAPQPPHRSGG